jgi:hypothetical protein
VADTKISALTDVVTLAGGDEFAINDVSAVASKKATLNEVATFIQAARFWVIWTGNSTTILDSFNTTSIADTAVGDADVTIGTDFASANWVAQVTGIETSGFTTTTIYSAGVNSIAAGVLGCMFGNMIDGGTAAGGLFDPDQWMVAGYGDQ